MPGACTSGREAQRRTQALGGGGGGQVLRCLIWGTEQAGGLGVSD